MTVLRAALLFDHPTTRLFASRILESFFCPPRSSLFSSSSSFALRALPPRLGSFLLPSFLASPFALRGARPPFVLFCYGPSVPFAAPRQSLTPLVPRQPPSIGVLCKQTHESERRIEGFPFSTPSRRSIVSTSSSISTSTSSSSSSFSLPPSFPLRSLVTSAC